MQSNICKCITIYDFDKVVYIPRMKSYCKRNSNQYRQYEGKIYNSYKKKWKKGNKIMHT